MVHTSAELHVRVAREPNPATARRGVDAMPDGEHVLGILSSTSSEDQATGPPRIVVVIDWFDELRQRAPLTQ